MNIFTRASVVVITGCLSLTTANAAPFLPLSAATGSSDLTLVQEAPPGMWRGYKGVRQQRPGYRRGDDGWWYPLAAFAAGAVIGGAIAGSGNGGDAPPPPPEGRQPPPPPGGGQARPDRLSPEHYAWCAKRYKSYSARDNSYVPRAGARAQCQSPFSY
ncbi:BA14K family protein [Rhizobium sp. S95]|uniref:Lectin-like protein BA14k n=1 Tax=Ciceribacter sichuanensis TaxID=2949647 RepID=A0AAJ1F9M4_9HYPH|nr:MULTISPECIES: BA14K family protein [unclassified Ciceribacter]MCM2398027.1 BA14K family protein [Ciceribacter sp. S95]MCO5959378.1 BA14K family protein [Ciceribacter sp. S101]